MTVSLREVPLSEVVPRTWALLERAVETNAGPLRLPVLASVGTDGRPQARVVVLREVDAQARTLAVYTDARSPKVAELAATPHAALCFYAPEEGLQLRIAGRVALHHADEHAQRAWDSAGLYARRSYLTTAAPGTPLESAGDGLPADYDPQVGSGEHLAVVRLYVEQLDWLVLSPEGHRRAGAVAGPRGSWDTSWLVP